MHLGGERGWFRNLSTALVSDWRSESGGYLTGAKMLYCTFWPISREPLGRFGRTRAIIKALCMLVKMQKRLRRLRPTVTAVTAITLKYFFFKISKLNFTKFCISFEPLVQFGQPGAIIKALN